MRNIPFVLFLIIVSLSSCTPNVILSPTTINSPFPNEVISLTLTHTPMPPTSGETRPLLATPWAFNSLASPNGEFIANAYFENYHPSGIQTIEIRNKEGKLIQQIPYQGEKLAGDPSPVLNIFQWSNDSSQLYFYYVWSPDGGDMAFWWTGYNLQKIDIKTGAIQPVLQSEDFMSFSISQDGTQIAYVRQNDQPSVIHVRDLPTGTEKTAYVLNHSTNFAIVGDIRWSPTGNEIAFQTQDSDYMVQTIYMNLLTMKQKIIQEYQVHNINFQGWTSDGRLEFREFGETGAQIIQVDVSNNTTIVIGTPTFSP